MVKVIRESEIISSHIKIADTFWLRLQGLIGKKALQPGEGLLLRPCSQVHTWFMKFAIDLIFLDQEGIIVQLVSAIAPGRVSPLVIKAGQVLELEAGTIMRYQLKEGEKLTIEG